MTTACRVWSGRAVLVAIVVLLGACADDPDGSGSGSAAPASRVSTPAPRTATTNPTAIEPSPSSNAATTSVPTTSAATTTTPSATAAPAITVEASTTTQHPLTVAPTTLLGAPTTDPRPHYDHCVEHEGRVRCWLEHAPVDPSTPATLVVDLHGYTGEARGQRGASGFESLATREGFIAVWPEGVDRSWSAGGCCGAQSADDVGFLRELVADVSSRRAVDRVFLTGLSNGCAMAQRFAAEASGVVDAVACMSFYLLSEPAADYTPVPVLEIHGTADIVVAYGYEPVFGGAVGNFERWASLNGCTGDAERPLAGGTSIKFATGCDAPVALLTLQDAGHVPYPGADTDIATTELAWRFMDDPSSLTG